MAPRSLGTPARISLDRFIEHQASDGFVLDVGAAASPYQHLFPRRIAFDISPRPGLDVRGDAEVLPFRDGAFDIVLSTELLEHVPNPQAVIAEFRRVLRPGGKCVLSTRFCYPLHDVPGDYFRFTRFGLEHLFRGWHVERIREDSGAVATIATLVHYMVWRRPQGSWRRRLAGLVWAPFWQLFQRAHLRALGAGVSFEEARFTLGYHVVARKP